MNTTISYSHRIDVDSCGECPFALHFSVPDPEPQCFCDHPATRAYELDPDVCDDSPPPKWCPLRGAVTMITAAP